MKKLILAMFFIFGMISFSALDKVIIAIPNDDYAQPVITGTPSRGGLANKLFGGVNDRGLGEQLYSVLKSTQKVTFIIEKNEEGTMVKVLKDFKKNGYSGSVEVIEVAKGENKEIREIIDTNKWFYKVYSSGLEVEGTIKIDGKDQERGKFINSLLTEIKPKFKR